MEICRSNGKNALHLAARQGHVEIVKALLDKDPQLARRTDKKGQTALHMAVKGQSTEVVKLLLDADAAIVMLPDKLGNTALHVATRKKRAEVFSLLSLNILLLYILHYVLMEGRCNKLCSKSFACPVYQHHERDLRN